jgi:hypothetical protein
MCEQLSGLLGLEGFTVTSVERRGDELDLEVELVAAGGCCPGCGRGSCEVRATGAGARPADRREAHLPSLA